MAGDVSGLFKVLSVKYLSLHAGQSSYLLLFSIQLLISRIYNVSNIDECKTIYRVRLIYGTYLLLRDFFISFSFFPFFFLFFSFFCERRGRGRGGGGKKGEMGNVLV